MGKNNQQRRKEKGRERLAEVRRKKTAALRKKAALHRSPKFLEMREAAIDALKEHMEAGKTPAEAEALVAAEVAEMVEESRRRRALQAKPEGETP